MTFQLLHETEYSPTMSLYAHPNIYFCRSLLVPFLLFILAIVLSVHFLFTVSDYPFDIYKRFLPIFFQYELTSGGILFQ